LVICSSMPPKQVTSDGADQPTPPEWEACDVFALQTQLRRLLTRETGSPEEALEIAQETYARFLKIPEDRRLRNPGGYLYRIAMNTLIEMREKKAGVVDFDSDIADSASRDLELDEPSVFDRLATEETFRCAVDKLPPEQRQAFWLCKVEGHTCKEAARQLGEKLGTIQKRVARALRQLRDALASDGRE
jgi:RNA polymerase sigma factor (sigma-70 family)